jgi:hypothetical protein
MKLRNTASRLFRSLYEFLYDRQQPIYYSRITIALQLNKKERDRGNIWDFLLGLALGSIGAHIFSTFAKPSCPVCKSKIEKEMLRCPYCHAGLEWK